MSGVLIKEWSAFVLKEVRARKEVERQMLALRRRCSPWEATFEWRCRSTARVDRRRRLLRSQVRKVYEEQAALRDKVVIFVAEHLPGGC